MIVCISVQKLHNIYKSMIENHLFFEQLLQSSQYELWDLSTLQPSTFTQRLMSFPCVGISQPLMHTIHQGIHEYKSQRAIMKYIEIIDKLIKVPSFIAAIHSTLVDIYTDLFTFLLLQKCQSEIMKLKILRKYWVGQLHPNIIIQMKETVWRKCNVDIDSGFKIETINQIKNYYENKLKLPPQEIILLLPTAIQNNRESANRSSADRQIQDKNSNYYVQTPQNNHYNYNASYAIQNPIPTIQHHAMPMQPIAPLMPPAYINYGQAQQTQGYPMRGPSGQVYPPYFQQPKRARLASQETRVMGAASLADQFEQPQPRKIPHKNQVILDYKSMLSRLKALSSFVCRECGMQFTTYEAQDKHSNEHFRIKMGAADKSNKNEAKRFYRLTTQLEWIADEQEIKYPMEKYCIPLSNSTNESRKCDFCCTELILQFNNNAWVYANAAIVRIGDRETILHKSCQLALDVSSEQQDYNENH